MPNDLSVSPSVLSTPLPAETQSRAEAEPAGQPTSGAAVAAKVAAASSTALFANPSLQLNADLGIVVIEFRDSEGSVTNQIPSQRQLDAYIAGSAQVPGGTQTPVPAPSTAASAAATPSASAQAGSLQAGTHAAAIQEAAAVAATAPPASATPLASPTSAPSKALSDDA